MLVLFWLKMSQPISRRKSKEDIEALHEIVRNMPPTREKKALLDILQRMTEEYVHGKMIY